MSTDVPRPEPALAWSRWGPDDERGALNLVDETARRRGLAAVRSAVPVSLGLPVGPNAAPHAGIRADTQHLMLRDGGDYAAGLTEKPGYGYADDMLIVACHGTTHLDALAHVWKDGVMWNGFSANEVTSRGARRAGIDKAGPIVTRGIFLDFGPDSPHRVVEDGESIEAADIERALDQMGVAPAPGDALIVRTGWLSRWRDKTASSTSWPGIGISCVGVVDRYDLALVGADTISVEVEPSGDPRCALPVHIALIRDRGVYLLELLDLEELAQARATTFLLVINPLKIIGGSGSPVAPLAVL
jgi:kynurenine formamidase